MGSEDLDFKMEKITKVETDTYHARVVSIERNEIVLERDSILDEEAIDTIVERYDGFTDITGWVSIDTPFRYAVGVPPTTLISQCPGEPNVLNWVSLPRLESYRYADGEHDVPRT